MGNPAFFSMAQITVTQALQSIRTSCSSGRTSPISSSWWSMTASVRQGSAETLRCPARQSTVIKSSASSSVPRTCSRGMFSFSIIRSRLFFVTFRPPLYTSRGDFPRLSK